jgi:ATP synthase subunit 6
VLFIFVLFCNILGLLPFGFTITSHIIVTFTLSFSVVLGLTIIGFREQKLHFLNLFIPRDVSKIMVPLLVVIEVVSYISRAFSLAIRLFANLMSGHTLLNILSTFVLKLLKKNFLFGILPFLLVLAICFLEICLAFLQAYVFMVLTCIYLTDSLYEAAH